MFGITHFEVFLLAGILLNITPGPDTFYILSRSIAQGPKAGIYSVMGIISGGAIHTALAALGLSVILAQSALAFTVVKTAGALYLGYIGITALLSRDQLRATEAEAGAAMRQIYTQGLLTNLFNPKVALFFLSFLPQFIDPQNAYGIMPFILLGCTFLTTGTLWCLLLVLCSGNMTVFLRKNDKASAIMNKVCGAAYILLGVKLMTAEQ
ncbi:lysine exporter (LYSE/YGGA) [Acetonema longum DSM 6540]|uniref:Lysine exporter (LYSE/YGGA) n=2 Tax=Acetonema TaxID=2373 RepID=F7NQG7_9FIRM|nr:lysine exporter (LYSE/YGGA) [Acetonema longum DSM 6540]